MKSALSLILSVCLAGTALPASAQEPAGADQARRVAIQLIGQPVTVKLSSSATVRGQIRDIADDYFVLLLDRTEAPVNIAYRDVRQLGPILQPVPQPGPNRVGIVIAAAGIALVGITSFVTRRGCRWSC